MGTIELLAWLVIIVGLVKLVVLFFMPEHILGMARIMYSWSGTRWLIIFLAAVVLYFLTSAGVTIVEILAIGLFMSLFMAFGLEPVIKDMLTKQKAKTLVQDNLLFIVHWVVLLVWAVVVLL